MGETVLAELAQVAAAFELGSLEQATPIHSGLIQATWKLGTRRGAFIAQKLHPAFQPLVTEDAAWITTYLQSQGIPCPTYVRTASGSLHLGSWRVMECLPGSVIEQIRDPRYVYQAAYWTGKVHHCLAGWDYTCQFQLPHFHDTAWIREHLASLNVPDDLQHLQTWLIETVPAYHLPEDLPRHLIHGDLKISNFLFNEQAQVTAILDWDTCLTHSPYLDLGDGLRSWCAENFDDFRIALQGYRDSGAPPAHPSLALQAWQLITLELAMRFLIDIVEDTYFAWDPQRYPSRVAHNRARLARQIEQFQRLAQQRDHLLKG